MTQSEFNKKELIKNIIQTAKEKELGFKYVLEEFKRNKWNINLEQAQLICNELNTNMTYVLFEAEDMNILNVDNSFKKKLNKQRKGLNDLKKDYEETV